MFVFYALYTFLYIYVGIIVFVLRSVHDTDFAFLSTPLLSIQFLTGAAILVGHVDVDAGDEGEHGADDFIASLPGGPHEGRPALQVGLVFHRRVRQKHADRLLQAQRKTAAVY